ncbi:MAG: SMC family ATPase [Candidatus Thermoplasmatota archaeon]|nr:SMC family ATPase [Candidatus Thermoplasmatota archaeon]
MKLQTLVLHNFRRFKHATIEFPEGVIGVVGLNGAGKSTIFEAIAWVLYGTVAARTSADLIKRNGAEPSDPCRIELGFLFDGSSYRVIREMTGKTLTASATIYKDDIQVATGAGESAKYIQKTLGLDYKSFYTSIYAKQKELNALSVMNASERRPLILRMLGIDALDEVIKAIGSYRRSVVSVISTLQSNLLDQKGLNRIDQLKNKDKELTEQTIKVTTEIDVIKQTLKKTKTDLSSQQQKTTEKRILYEENNRTYERLGEQKARYDQYLKISKEITLLEAKVQKREKEIDPLHKKITFFPDLSNELKDVEKRLQALDSQTKETIRVIEQKKTKKQELSNQIKQLKQKQKNITDLGPNASCPTCERILEDQYQFLLTKYQNESLHKTDEDRLLEDHIAVQQETYQRLKREMAALNKKKEYLYHQQTEKQTILATLTSLQKEFLKEQSELKKKIEEQKQLEKNTFDPVFFEKMKGQVKTSYQMYQKELKQIDILKDLYSSTQLTAEKKQSMITILKKEKRSVLDRIKELQLTEKKIKEKQKIAEDLSLLQETMMSFRSHLISRIRPALSSYASSFFQELTDGKYQEISLDEQYNMLLFDEGESYSIERFSGGEIDLANLCLRLAISEVITERSQGVFQFIILDEIFGSQDAIRQQNIMEALHRLSSKFRQIFLITHVEDVKHHMGYVLQVEESNGVSNIQVL